MKALVIIAALFLTGSALAESDFFEIKAIRFLNKPGSKGEGIWDRKNRKDKSDDVFFPCIEVKISAEQAIHFSGLSVTAHFFDSTGRLQTTINRPAEAARTTRSMETYDVPTLLEANKPDTVFFLVPTALLKEKWSAVVVFGDKNEVVARRVPDGSLYAMNFPQKDFVLAPPKKRIARKEYLNPVNEHVVHTQNPKHPQITLFLRAPNGVTDSSEIKGVLAMCMAASSLDDIRRKLQDYKIDDYGPMLKFADKNKLAIICWGSRLLWRADASHDELEREAAIEIDRSFDVVADAWERGVRELTEKYGIPKSNYLLWGHCASAQWAHRLALRKPELFLAAYIHIPSSFDKPTPDGAKMLWLLTTGELDGGYQRASRWFQECRDAGYPMIYKPIMNLGHASSDISKNLGVEFFQYALSVQNQRVAMEPQWAAFRQRQKLEGKAYPWLESFRDPQYVGDYLNQELFVEEKKGKVPAAFRVPLPTKALADAWNK